MSMRDDVLYTFRSVRSRPALVVAAMLTLALAIGINAAMVGLVGRALLGAPEHLVRSAGVLMFAVAVAATMLPARAASRSDPATLLRS